MVAYKPLCCIHYICLVNYSPAVAKYHCLRFYGTPYKKYCFKTNPQKLQILGQVPSTQIPPPPLLPNTPSTNPKYPLHQSQIPPPPIASSNLIFEKKICPAPAIGMGLVGGKIGKRLKFSKRPTFLEVLIILVLERASIVLNHENWMSTGRIHLGEVFPLIDQRIEFRSCCAAERCDGIECPA